MGLNIFFSKFNRCKLKTPAEMRIFKHSRQTRKRRKKLIVEFILKNNHFSRVRETARPLERKQSSFVPPKRLVCLSLFWFWIRWHSRPWRGRPRGRPSRGPFRSNRTVDGGFRRTWTSRWAGPRQLFLKQSENHKSKGFNFFGKVLIRELFSPHQKFILASSHPLPSG